MTNRVILCVDDEKIVLNSLKTQLREKYADLFNYEIAENADDAFEIIEDLVGEGFDIIVIVSDWLMPGIKGDEFLIKIHQQFPKIVTILLTGHADEKAIQKAKDFANLHKCLRKPWSEAELFNAIETGLKSTSEN
ncbi:MAG: response regulator [Bacteroidota bacterium]|jgi:CheY-like chemotaxis protein